MLFAVILINRKKNKLYYEKINVTPAIVLMAGSAFAQITLTPATAEIVGDPAVLNEVHVEFHNEGANQTMTWVRTVNDIPAEWKSSVCDFNLCWADFADSPDDYFEAPADTVGTVYVKFDARNFHDGAFNPMPGCGTVEVNFFSVLDSANYNALGVFHARLGVEEGDCKTVIASPSLDNSFLIYPNPAVNTINAVASFSADIHHVDIVDITGSIVSSYNWETTSGKMTFNMTDLPTGIYFVRLVDKTNVTVYAEKVIVQ
ncbi:MAG: T9SS type A sorting domain-containing protein [Bacteroidetes bacterium]|nr:T9SS type A sorting domain-containing protein [Bacteroidota bacterium]